jgi:hypothetical protein
MFILVVELGWVVPDDEEFSPWESHERLAVSYGFVDGEGLSALWGVDHINDFPVGSA